MGYPGKCVKCGAFKDLKPDGRCYICINGGKTVKCPSCGEVRRVGDRKATMCRPCSVRKQAIQWNVSLRKPKPFDVNVDRP